MADGDTLEIRFTLDGEEKTATIGKKDVALPLLRDHFGCDTLKAGCSPQGVCGSCAAMVGGKPRLTCTLPAKAMNDKDVVTQAGLPADEARAIGEAFAASGLAQEGYTVPGLVIAFLAARNAAKGEPLTAEGAQKAVGLHVTRTVGWQSVIDAFLLADAVLRGEADAADAAAGGWIPQHLVQAALGRRPSIDDLTRPVMLHGAVVFAPHARCTIGSVDTAAAEAAEGVVAVLTAADLPGAPTHGSAVADWPVLVAEGQTTRGCADLVAVVAARTRAQARAAAALVAIEAEALEPDTDVNHAAGHAERIVHRVERTHGDPRGALDASTHQARAQVETAGSDPTFVEPEAALAVPLEGGGFRVHAAGHDLFRDLEQLAAVAGIGVDKLELVHLPAGGSGGSRVDLGITPHALLLAQATDRPVKLALEMSEGSRLHAGRHPTWSTVQLGCDDDGRFTALRARVILDTGGHTGGGPLVAETIARHLTLAYDIDAVELDVLCVRSDNPPSGASTSLGVSEYAFAVETVIDRLAADVGLDPVELRRRNLLKPGAETAAGWTVPRSFAPQAVIDALSAERTRLEEAGHQVGVAFGVHALGLPEDLAAAELEVVSAGHVRIHVGFSELGQGFDTQAIRAAAAVTGLAPEVFEVVSSTARNVASGPTLSGRDRRLGIPAVEAAAKALAKGGDLADLVGQSFAGEASMGPALGFTAQACAIDEGGLLAELVVAVDAGPHGDDPHTLAWIAGHGELGLEWAVTAERAVDDDAMPETRWTKLGVLKARHCPTVTVVPVAGPEVVPLEDTIVSATAAAVANALAKVHKEHPVVVPMQQGPHAKKMGIRPKRR